MGCAVAALGDLCHEVGQDVHVDLLDSWYCRVEDRMGCRIGALVSLLPAGELVNEIASRLVEPRPPVSTTTGMSLILYFDV